MTQNAQFFLFLSLLASIVLHWEHLPWWSLALSACAMAWRFAVYIFNFHLPGPWIKGLAVLSGFTGVYLTFGWQPSIESMVALLVTGVALKPLEVQKAKDSYLLVFLCFMVQGMHFLFEQEPLDYLLVLGCFILSLQGLFSLHHGSPSAAKGLGSIKYGTKIFWMSLPLALVFFFVLPRLGPLWTLNIKTEANRIGLSESMSPGDISNLGRNTELAFRVQFSSEAVPLMSERYWRALVLDYYDGVTWSMKFREGRVNKESLAGSTTVYQYRVTQPANDQRWLFSLEKSVPMTSGIDVSKSGFFTRRVRNIAPVQFDAYTTQQGKAVTRLEMMEQYAYLQLPASVNPKARQLAQGLAVTHQGELDIDATLSSFAQYIVVEPFSYTLNPGEMTSDSRVDEFLFDRQQGFCAHYAGSLVFMLRSLGVPSRVVVGYLGGEYNRVSGDYSIYQYDAHAWVEYWNNGWNRVDPTGWVSPERVDQGLEASVDDFAGFSSSIPWINDLRQQMQALNYYWQDWMLEYKGEKQQALLSAITGQSDPSRSAYIIGVVILGITGLLIVWLTLSGRESRSYEQKLHRYLLTKAEKKGAQVTPGMTPATIFALTQCHRSNEVRSLIQEWNGYLYSEGHRGMGWRDYRTMKRRINQLLD